MSMTADAALVTSAREAMATRFEIALHGDDSVRLRAAAGEALDEITRLEGMLSLYEPTSEIAHCNQRASQKPVPVSAEVFNLLKRCQKLTAKTIGAFDITIAPLMQCWRFIGNTGGRPSGDEIESALQNVGMCWVELNEANTTVRFRRQGVMLDMGSIGKGYALERASALLEENEFTDFLIHGGTSTVCARGTQPDGSPWRIAIKHPDDGKPPLRIVELHNEALSVSGIGGKSFLDADGNEQGHVIDPHTGHPTQSARVSAVIHADATASDALATALLTKGSALLRQLPANTRALTASMVEKQLVVQTQHLH
ncbi:MAG: hypothetical protein CMO74_13240 [Verrucomicrobiales bacterium]|nr:hypothetical protein [Verrucomicrobiales bacterium]|tara:strand:- start:27828 stop:28763 length:936 start_codon:yes stop_codon:yes gene_type:complete